MASQKETLCSNMEGVLSLGNFPLTLLSLQLYLRSLVCCTSPTYPSHSSPPLPSPPLPSVNKKNPFSIRKKHTWGSVNLLVLKCMSSLEFSKESFEV